MVLSSIPACAMSSDRSLDQAFIHRQRSAVSGCRGLTLPDWRSACYKNGQFRRLRRITEHILLKARALLDSGGTTTQYGGGEHKEYSKAPFPLGRGLVSGEK